jgi:non-heme Fe2+,alpha-ketoglutarate-dependent halogenase
MIMTTRVPELLLTPDEMARFERDGVFGPFKIYEPDVARELLKAIRMRNVDRTHALHRNDVNYDRHFDIPELSQHIGHPNIVGRVRVLLGMDLLCWRTEFFPKFPGAPGTEWHQVANYRYATGVPMLEPAADRADDHLDITVWTAFTEATRENGCLRFLPGSHKKIYYDESSAVTRRTDQYRSIEAPGQFFGYDFQEFKVDPTWMPDEDQAVAMEMHAGECVIFTAKCVHASFPNTTKRQTRFAITARYTSTDVRVYAHERKFRAHGGDFDLDAVDYACVLVSGRDRYGHNRIRSYNNLGQPFPHVV